MLPWKARLSLAQSGWASQLEIKNTNPENPASRRFSFTCVARHILSEKKAHFDPPKIRRETVDFGLDDRGLEKRLAKAISDFSQTILLDQSHTIEFFSCQKQDTPTIPEISLKGNLGHQNLNIDILRPTISPIDPALFETSMDLGRNHISQFLDAIHNGYSIADTLDLSFCNSHLGIICHQLAWQYGFNLFPDSSSGLSPQPLPDPISIELLDENLVSSLIKQFHLSKNEKVLKTGASPKRSDLNRDNITNTKSGS